MPTQPTQQEDKILRFCSRCGITFCKLGKIIEYGKHYPAFTKKNGDGTVEDMPEDDEIKKAVCVQCAKELFDSELKSLWQKEAREEVLKELILEAEPYENSKWHNYLSIETIKRIINSINNK